MVDQQIDRLEVSLSTCSYYYTFFSMEICSKSKRHYCDWTLSECGI